MADTMRKSLGDAGAQEEASIKSFTQLMAAKMKEDLTDTQEALAEDTKFLQGLEKSCKTKTAEWEERSKTRSEELMALADTIKILNDDDALELFKKTLPSA